MFRLALEARAEPQRFMRLGAPIVALLLTTLASAPLFWSLGLNPLLTLKIFFVEPLSTANGISEWLLKASPLVLIALGLSVGFRANVWNIGAEGMYTVGAICAAWLALHFGEGMHRWLLPAMMLAGALGGMAWAAIPALLKTRASANEILVTLMLNYVAALLLAYLVNGPMQDPEGLNYPQTASFGPSALFTPLWKGMRINGSVFVTLAAMLLYWAFVESSFIGFQMKVSGIAPTAARYAGFRQSRMIWLSLMVSGATAGLAGMMEAAGPLGQLSPVISPGYGFAAIIVAFVGRLSPLGVLLGGLLLSLLYLGGEAVQMSLNVPASLARTFQGLLLFFLLSADVLIAYRVRVRRRQ
jgi:general nucleoside transport system permease protein